MNIALIRVENLNSEQRKFNEINEIKNKIIMNGRG